QRTVGKAHSSQMEKLENNIKGRKYKQYRIRKMMLQIQPSLKKNKEFMANLRDPDLTDEWILEHHKALVEAEKEKIEKKFAKDNEKLAAEGQKELKADVLKERLKAATEMEKMYAKEFKTGKVEITTSNNTIEKCEANIEKLNAQIEALIAQKTDKEENKSVALGTSKLVRLTLCL